MASLFSCLRFDVVLVPLALRRYLDGVALGDDVDVALEVTLGAAGDVVGVGQQGPLVVELVVYRSLSLSIRESMGVKMRGVRNVYI